MKRPEQEFQISLVSGLRKLLPSGWLLHHSPNGGYRTQVEAAKFRTMGVVAGWPDLILVGPGKVVFMELKAPPKTLAYGKPSKAVAALSDAQLSVIKTLAGAGWPVLVVRSIDEAVDALKALGVPLRGRSL